MFDRHHSELFIHCNCCPRKIRKNDNPIFFLLRNLFIVTYFRQEILRLSYLLEGKPSRRLEQELHVHTTWSSPITDSTQHHGHHTCTSSIFYDPLKNVYVMYSVAESRAV
ncbi:unnamed protein product [Amoebophrya sp. A25]|nr:unnamed protein product [Amoebophrya sp. A25]|eukprot:GSA25T00015412001.1